MYTHMCVGMCCHATCGRHRTIYGTYQFPPSILKSQDATQSWLLMLLLANPTHWPTIVIFKKWFSPHLIFAAKSLLFISILHRTFAKIPHFVYSDTFKNQNFASFTARLSPEPNWPEPISSFCRCLKGCSQSQEVCFSKNTSHAWVTHAYKYLLASWPQTKHLSSEVCVILALLSDSSLQDNIAFLGHWGRKDSLMWCHHSVMTHGACLEPWVLFGGACAVTGLSKFVDLSQKGSKSPCIWHF